MVTVPRLAAMTRNGLPIRISGTDTSYRPNLAIMAAAERQAIKYVAALCHGTKKVHVLQSELRRKRDAYIQKRYIISNRPNAGILQKTIEHFKNPQFKMSS